MQCEEWKQSISRLDALRERYGYWMELASAPMQARDLWLATQAEKEQMLNIVQTVEAIRWYTSEHEEQLPNSLSDLPVPISVDTFTGIPFEWNKFVDGSATLVAYGRHHQSYRLMINVR